MLCGIPPARVLTERRPARYRIAARAPRVRFGLGCRPLCVPLPAKADRRSRCVAYRPQLTSRQPIAQALIAARSFITRRAHRLPVEYKDPLTHSTLRLTVEPRGRQAHAAVLAADAEEALR